MPKVTNKSGTKKTAKKAAAKTTKASSAPQKNVKPYLFTIFIGVILLAILIGQLFVVANMSRKIEYLNMSMGGVIDEVGAKLTITDQLSLLGNDMNELRSYLYLPTKEYSFGTDSVVSETDELSEDTDYNRGMYMVLENIHTEQEKETLANDAQKTLQNISEIESYVAELTNAELQFNDSIITEGDLIYLPINQPDGTQFAKLTYHLDIDQWELYDYALIEFYDSEEDFQEIVSTYISQISETKKNYTAYKQLQSEISALWTAQDVAAKLTEKALHIENNEIKNIDDEVLVSVSIDTANGANAVVWNTGESTDRYETFESFKDNVIEMIEILDTRTLVERRVSEQQAVLDSILSDPAFTKVLEDYELSIATEPLYEDDRIYYPISDLEGTIKKQIIIERNTDADILVVDSDGLNPIPLKSFFQDEGSKKK